MSKAKRDEMLSGADTSKDTAKAKAATSTEKCLEKLTELCDSFRTKLDDHEKKLDEHGSRIATLEKVLQKDASKAPAADVKPNDQSTKADAQPAVRKSFTNQFPYHVPDGKCLLWAWWDDEANDWGKTPFVNITTAQSISRRIKKYFCLLEQGFIVRDLTPAEIEKYFYDE